MAEAEVLAEVAAVTPAEVAAVTAVTPAEVAAEVAVVVTPEGLRRRRRLEVSRERLTVRLSAEELSEIGVAARRAGLRRPHRPG